MWGKRRFGWVAAQYGCMRCPIISKHGASPILVMASTSISFSPGRTERWLRDSLDAVSPQCPPGPSKSDDVKIRPRKLRRQLSDSVKGAYIPAGLKKAIEQDPEFRLSLSIEPIDPETFDYGDRRTLADFYTI